MILDNSLPSFLSGMLDEKCVTIYLFHGVIESSDNKVRNYTGKHIELDLFHSCLSVLKKNGNALSMEQIYDHLTNKIAFPKNSYAVTFDDGFENNYSIALPALTEIGIPATIYISTDFINSNTMSWADRMEHLVEQSRENSVRLPFCTETYPMNTAKDRIALLKDLRKHVKTTPDCDVNDLIAELGELLKCDLIFHSDHPLDKKMNWDQVIHAAGNDLITIGGHSHTHPILSFLGEQELEFEISMSVRSMKEKASIEPNHYSYPEGLAHCFNNNVINKLKSYGVKCCPTAIYGNNSIHEDPFHLKRILIMND